MDNYQQHPDITPQYPDKFRFKLSIYMTVMLCIPPILTFFFRDNLPWLTGVFPQSIEGLRGILTAPLVHADWEHLAGNISALVILFLVLFNNYAPMAWPVIALSYIVPNVWAWFFARPAWHVGASGIVYSIAAFIFFTGLMRSQTRLIALSFFVVFMYGSIFWGIFPMVPEVSWETHLSGFVLGLMLAFYYRKDLKVMYPVKKYFEDELDDSDEYSSEETSEINDDEK